MNRLVKIFIGIVVVFVLAILVMFYATSGMTNTADAFFAAVKDKNIALARSYLSEDFKASTDEKTLQDFLTRKTLIKFKKASWSNRQISGGRGELTGSITTESGGTVPIKLELIKENGNWLIYSIYKPEAGIIAEESGKAPSEREEVALINESMETFAQSVNAKDFSEFYGYISNLWRRQISTQKLNEIFKPFMDRDINLLVLKNFSPIFDGQPTLDDNGILTIKGRYPTKPSSVMFEFSYVYEGTGWKLIGARVNIQPSS